MENEVELLWFVEGGLVFKSFFGWVDIIDMKRCKFEIVCFENNVKVIWLWYFL